MLQYFIALLISFVFPELRTWTAAQLIREKLLDGNMHYKLTPFWIPRCKEYSLAYYI